MLCIELEKTLLIGTGSMEDQMPESELHIGRDAGDMFVRIRRHDKARRGACRRQLVSEPLHLQGVIDGHFLVGG